MPVARSWARHAFAGVWHLHWRFSKHGDLLKAVDPGLREHLMLILATATCRQIICSAESPEERMEDGHGCQQCNGACSLLDGPRTSVCSSGAKHPVPVSTQHNP
mmetsp:Transcript_67866/g.198594  ORF Transcript_67866/g.198594 Transcript_67866/m.198594 type:complete len:104 (-) Transcript_67866:22-333(-)